MWSSYQNTRLMHDFADSLCCAMWSCDLGDSLGECRWGDAITNYAIFFGRGVKKVKKIKMSKSKKSIKCIKEEQN